MNKDLEDLFNQDIDTNDILDGVARKVLSLPGGARLAAETATNYLKQVMADGPEDSTTITLPRRTINRLVIVLEGLALYADDRPKGEA